MAREVGSCLGHYDGGSTEDAGIVSLEPGQTLGLYKVVTLPGEGGVGQAWQVRDTMLDAPTLALRISPSAVLGESIHV